MFKITSSIVNKSFLIILFSQILFAAPISVLNPTKFKATLPGSTYNKSFTHTQDNAQGVLTVVNGDGSDLSPKDCRNLDPLRTLICKAENVVRALAVALFRASSIEVTANGQVLVTSTQLPPAIGKYQKPLIVKLNNTLKVKVKGSPLAFITVDIKAESQSVNQNPIANFTATPGTGAAPIIISFSGLASSDPDGAIVSYAWEFGDGDVATGAVVNHLYNTPGNYNARLTVTDNQGAIKSKTQTIVISQDTVAPSLSLSSPAPGSTITNSLISVGGQANERLSAATAQLNGETEYSLTLSPDKMSFSGQLNTSISGSRVLTVRGRDLAGNQSETSVTFAYVNSEPPNARLSLRTANSGVAPHIVLFDGNLSSDPLSLPLSYSWNFGDGNSVSTPSGLATHIYENPGIYTAVLTVTNSAGLSDSEEVVIQVAELELPSSPETIAPPLVQNNVVKPFNETISFIYEGPNALQKGVLTNTIDPSRVSIIKGQVLDENEQPLSGVKVTVVKGPNLGYTYSRENGKFDIAVNGGASTTVQYEKNGYLSAQRTVRVNYNDISTADTAILVKVDPVVSFISNESPQIQVVKGSQIQDGDGQRTATLLIPASTKASIELPNGQWTELPTLSLRITEYTIGEKGPDRMPASLPKSSSYTYAVDVTADEALALNAKHIRFSKPVSFYVDNFLNFPVGSVIPVGSYDYNKGAWLPEANGRVIRILSVQNGRAILDVTGNGSPATEVQLSELLINDEELQKISEIYVSGKTFWRSMASRFSPFDLNMLAAMDGLPPSNALGANDLDAPDGCPCRQGSVIEVITQNLREYMPIVGTGLRLGYSSNNAVDMPDSLEVRLTSSEAIPAELQQVDLQIEVAGQVYKRSFPASMDLTHTYLWNGHDVYGRKVDGRIKAKVRITYHYPSTYLTPLLQFPSEFGMYPVKLSNSGVPGREWASLSTDYDTFMGKPSMARRSIGEWFLPIYHSYNVEEKYLTMGDGSMIGGIDPKFSRLRPLEVVMGNGTSGYSPDGTLAKNARLNSPHPILYGSDRSIYFSDRYPFIRRIKPNGAIETIAGTGGYGYSGDGGPAVNATFRTGLNSIKLVEGEEKEFYIADIGNCVVRKIDRNGIINTVAGTGVCGYSGNDGPARQARLGTIFHLNYYQGSLFIAESNNYTIREITAGGRIRVVVGNGTAGYSPDGTQATEASIANPAGIAFTSEGEIVFPEVDNHIIRKVNRMGVLETIVGNRTMGNSPDGTPAAEASITYPLDVKVRPDNSVYYRDGSREQIRYVAANGTLQTLAGIGGHGVTAGGEIALRARLGGIRQFDFSPDGDVYIVEQDNHRIVKVTSPLNIQQDNNGFYPIPASDGSEIYLFDYQGIHVRTLYGKTSATKYQFAHDAKNQLVQIIDGDSNVTMLTRDADGAVTDITAPYSQRTRLAYTSGKLSSLVKPDSSAFAMTYSQTGQLASFTKANGSTSTFIFDSTGRLLRDTNSAGGFTALQRTIGDSSETIRATTAEGVFEISGYNRTQNYSSVSNRESSGKSVSTISYADGATLISKPNSYSEVSFRSKDQRLGLPVSYVSDVNLRLGGLEKKDVYRRTYTRLVDSTDYQMTEQNQVNSVLKRSSIFDSLTRTYSITSGENRTSSMVVDAKERPSQLQTGNLERILYSRDDRGRLTQVSQGNRHTVNTYGSNGLVASTTDVLGHQNSYQYDDNLRLVKEVLPGGSEVNYQYDNNDNIIAITPPSRPVHQMDFNLVDLLTSYAPPALGGGNVTTTYAYNLDKKLTSVNRPDGKSIAYNYNQTTGLLGTIQTQSGNYSHQYNSVAQLTQISSPYGVLTNISYLSDLPAGHQSYVNGIYFGGVSLAYDNDHRVSSVLINSNDQAQRLAISYDRDDNIIGFGSLAIFYNGNSLVSGTQLGSVQQTYGYNGFGELLSSSVTSNSNPAYSLILDRDDIGRVTTKTEDAVSSTYSYDPAGRLQEVKRNGNQVGLYSYDLNGNRISSNVRGVNSTATYDNQDRLLTYGNKSYTYNNNGDLMAVTDLITNVSKTYSYDEFGNLSQVVIPGKNIQYLADGFKRRVVKRVNGNFLQSFTYLNQTQIVSENDVNGAAISKFVYATKTHSPDYMIKGSVIYKIVSDQLGSVRKVVNASAGVVVQEISYDEFGVVLSDTNPGFQPFGFAGGLYDADTGLVRFGARDYDPEIGRWTSKDPILFKGGNTNLFGYVLNNPINFIDPTGLSDCPAADFLAQKCLDYRRDMANLQDAIDMRNTEFDIKDLQEALDKQKIKLFNSEYEQRKENDMCQP